MPESVDDIDRLIAAPKRIAGIVEWKFDDRGTAILKSGLEVDGGLLGSLFLTANVTIRLANPRGHCGLIYRHKPIERLNFNPREPHTNRHDKEAGILRGKIIGIGVHRYYAWSKNRRHGWPQSMSNLSVAEELTRAFKDFDDALAFFCRRVHIAGEIPPAPFGPELFP